MLLNVNRCCRRSPRRRRADVPGRPVARMERKRNPGPPARHLAPSRIALRSIRATAPRLYRPLSIPSAENIPLYRNSVLAYVSPIPAHQEGRSRGRLDREPGCGGRGSVGTMAAGRAGSPCEPETACRRATLNAYGKTVWSWPSLLRSSRIEDVREPNRVDGIIQFERRGRPKESSAPGRARHKPSDHRAGKAV